MEQVRAFKGQEAPEKHTIIDAKALHAIKDIAQKVVMEERREFELHRTLFTALHQYMSQRGNVPTFEVKL